MITHHVYTRRNLYIPVKDSENLYQKVRENHPSACLVFEQSGDTWYFGWSATDEEDQYSYDRKQARLRAMVRLRESISAREDCASFQELISFCQKENVLLLERGVKVPHRVISAFQRLYAGILSRTPVKV